MSFSLARKELARLIDHTLLTAHATRPEIETLCAEARQHGFFGVCVSGTRVVEAAHFLEESGVKVTCAIDHPLGAADSDAKRYETEVAIDHGAQIIEVSANIGRLKDGEGGYVLRELRDVIEAADERPVSVAFDSSLLTPEELDRLSRAAVEAGAKGITVSASLGAVFLLENVERIREIVGDNFGLKSDGAMFELPAVTALLSAGATRFGLTEGVKLLQSLAAK